jgi:hypothetical protein
MASRRGSSRARHIDSKTVTSVVINIRNFIMYSDALLAVLIADKDRALCSLPLPTYCLHG